MPPKMATREEEKRDRLLERKEADLTRLTAAKSKLEGQQRHYEEKKATLGRMVVACAWSPVSASNVCHPRRPSAI